MCAQPLKGFSPDPDYTPSVSGPEPTSRDRICARNYALWCQAAARATQFCKLCGFPLDLPFVSDVITTPTITRCVVCEEMERTLRRHPYWEALEQEDNRKRRNMGIE